MFYNKNHIVLGIILGICVPILAYAFFLYVFDLFDQLELTDINYPRKQFRERTIGMLAIAAELVPFEIYRKLKYDQTMRGLIFPTVLYVVVWIIYYGKSVF
jgi:amino acid permease